jgi:hypothetical protein
MRSDDQGSLNLIAKVDDRVLPGTVLCYKGRATGPGAAKRPDLAQLVIDFFKGKIW